jgi:HlyD family secretion protein
MAEITRRKWMILLPVAALAVSVILVLALRREAPPVTFVKVAREGLNQTITSNGKVEPISPVVARAEFPTFVEKVMAAEGQPVRRGQIILTLDAADIRSQLAEARGNLLAAETDLRHANAGGAPEEMAQLQGDLRAAEVEVASLERTGKALKELVAKQAATEDELAQNQSALTKAQAHLQALQQRKEALAQNATVNVESSGLRAGQAREQVQSLEEKVNSAVIRSTVDGTLYSLPVRAGDYVKIGDQLAELADLRHVQVRAYVDEPDLGWLEPNEYVQVTWDAKPGLTWSGRTEQTPKQVVPHGTRSVGEVLCSVDNSKLELLPNINVEVRIVVRERPNALVVPRETVHEEQGKHYVYVMGDGKVHRRDVTVGASSASKYEVLSGLAQGDQVALQGDLQLQDGMDIRAVGAN